MKKVRIMLFLVLVGFAFKGYSQAAPPPDFFSGKWEILVVGIPDGDTKYVTELVRKDGKLTGELKDPTGTKPATPITKIEETGSKITIHFDFPQAGDIPIELAKVDDDHLKGNLYGMFDATALRVKK